MQYYFSRPLNILECIKLVALPFKRGTTVAATQVDPQKLISLSVTQSTEGTQFLGLRKFSINISELTKVNVILILNSKAKCKHNH